MKHTNFCLTFNSTKFSKLHLRFVKNSKVLVTFTCAHASSNWPLWPLQICLRLSNINNNLIILNLFYRRIHFWLFWEIPNNTYKKWIFLWIYPLAYFMPLMPFLPPENRKPGVNGFARIFSNSVCTVRYNDQKESRLLLYILREDNPEVGKIQK